MERSAGIFSTPFWDRKKKKKKKKFRLSAARKEGAFITQRSWMMGYISKSIFLLLCLSKEGLFGLRWEASGPPKKGGSERREIPALVVW